MFRQKAFYLWIFTGLEETLEEILVILLGIVFAPDPKYNVSEEEYKLFHYHVENKNIKNCDYSFNVTLSLFSFFVRYSYSFLIYI